MLPRDLKPESFSGYPAQAGALALAHLDSMRRLPLPFLPSLLRQVIDYDFSFPIEQSMIKRELAILDSLPESQRIEWFGAFSSIALSASLENFDWINLPSQFVEQQSAYLWSTHQLDAFRKAATDYGAELQAAVPPAKLPVPR